MSTLLDIDRQISAIPVLVGKKRKRILYFKSGDRDILQKAVDHSSALWGMVKSRQNGDLKRILDNKKPEDRFLNLKKEKRIFDFREVFKKKTKENIEEWKNGVLFTLTDFHVWREEERGIIVKKFLDLPYIQNAILLISSPFILIPTGFEEEIELINLKPIDTQDILEILANRPKKKAKVSEDEMKKLAGRFRGLSEGQINVILESTYSELGISCELDANSDKQRETCARKTKELIKQEKTKAALKDATVDIIETAESEKVVGMGEFEKWIDSRSDVFNNPEKAAGCYGISGIKGILLTGVPGTGKTAMARETARRLGSDAALVQFRLDRLQTKDYGGSEANLSRYLEQVESMAPCVMLIDEIEKTFQGKGNEMHEVKRQMLGQLLDWMQNRRASVMTFMTANSIKNIAPELLRDGRISERFFVFMPTRDDLVQILCSQLMRIADGIDRKRFGPLYDDDLLNRIIDKSFGREVIDALGAENKKRHTYGFFTGANIEKLIMTANIELKVESSQRPYTYEMYKEKLISCALKIRAQGQTNMRDIIDTWFDAKENDYQNVSDSEIVPFSEFDEEAGKFNAAWSAKYSDSNESVNPYDAYFFKVLSEKIESEYQQRLNKVLEKKTKSEYQ